MKKTILLLAILLVLTCSAYASDGFPLDRNEVNGFDSLLMFPYNENLDKMGTALQLASMLTPSVLLAEPLARYPEIGVMYLETVALAWGAKELLKTVVDRPRPFMYADGYPQSEVDNGDWNDSFPSGHTTLAFAGATFASYVFSKYHPESKWKVPVTAVSYSLACATAASRIAAGRHFMTDVLTGALLGTAIGYAVPALHTLLADSSIEASASPFGLMFSIAF